MICELLLDNYQTILLLLLSFILYMCVIRRQHGVPNGPFVFPIVGNLPALNGTDVMKNFQHLRREYGDVYGLYFGRDLVVVLNGYDVIHDALVKKGNVFSVRPRTMFHKIMFKDRGIVFANDTLWKEHRQFAQMALNEFGYNWAEKSIEDRINEEVRDFIKRLEQLAGPFDIRDYVNLSIANVISGILFGKRYSYDDPKFVACLEGVGEAASLFARAGVMMNCFPFLRHLPGDLIGLNKIEKVREKPSEFINGPINEHCKTFDENHIRDVADLYMKEIKENDELEKGNNFTPVQMRTLMAELLSAGSETTAITIIWILLYIILHPEIQAKLHRDIDEAIGKDRIPSLDDRKKLPFIEATILEGLRIAPVAPLSVPHAVHEDVTYKGFNIPADTTVFVNLHSVLKDPTIWPEPDVFKPQRFLDKNGSVSIPQEFIPFSIGRRACLGESLARKELFLYVTSLLQKFEFSIPTGDPVPSVEGHLGMTYSPYRFRVVVKAR